MVCVGPSSLLRNTKGRGGGIDTNGGCIDRHSPPPLPFFPTVVSPFRRGIRHTITHMFEKLLKHLLKKNMFQKVFFVSTGERAKLHAVQFRYPHRCKCT